MDNKATRTLLYIALFVLFLLHNDFWLWEDASLIFGLPAGLAYHALYCLVAAGLMALLVNLAWPEHLDVSDDGGAEL